MYPFGTPWARPHVWTRLASPILLCSRAMNCASIVSVVLVTLAVTACTPAPPGAAEARTYVTSIEPLVYENGLLAQSLLTVAAEVHGADITSESLTRWWHDDFTPLTQHLAHQGAAVSPPPAWSERHQELVTVWELRADAYNQLDRAVAQGDASAWSAGRSQADTAKIREEEWFRSSNETLAPYGLALDQYP